MTLTDEFSLKLAANLAWDLFQAGAARLRNLTPDDPGQHTLQACYEAAFREMLAEVAAGLTTEEADLLGDVLRSFVREADVTDGLLNLALAGAPLPDLPALRRAFDQLDFDRATLTVDFDRALTAFHRGLTAALVERAGKPGSPLFNRVNLGRVLAIQALIAQQQHTLEEIAEQLRSLERAPGGAGYNIIIQQATGVAIGDYAQVIGSLPAEVQATLREILDALKRLLPPPDQDSDELLHPYLDWLIRQHSTLELRGIRYAGQSPTVPLEQVYAALQAETVAESEWQESRRLLEQEFAEWLERQRLGDLPPEELRRHRWRFLAGHPLMPALEERDRPALFGQRKPALLHLAEAVRRYRWLVILGDPGSGKTTLARWLTLQLARALRQGQARVQVPAVHVDPQTEDDAAPVDLGPPACRSWCAWPITPRPAARTPSRPLPCWTSWAITAGWANSPPSPASTSVVGSASRPRG